MYEKNICWFTFNETLLIARCEANSFFDFFFDFDDLKKACE